VLGVAGCATSARRTRAQSPSQKSDTQADFRILARDGDGILSSAIFFFSHARFSLRDLDEKPRRVLARSQKKAQNHKNIASRLKNQCQFLVSTDVAIVQSGKRRVARLVRREFGRLPRPEFFPSARGGSKPKPKQTRRSISIKIGSV
jgi:hypothetical protein